MLVQRIDVAKSRAQFNRADESKDKCGKTVTSRFADTDERFDSPKCGRATCEFVTDCFDLTPYFRFRPSELFCTYQNPGTMESNFKDVKLCTASLRVTESQPRRQLRKQTGPFLDTSSEKKRFLLLLPVHGTVIRLRKISLEVAYRTLWPQLLHLKHTSNAQPL